ncbi:MAG: MerR family transcriptional regulator [Clostridium sp.]|nr:MerR family transcriptional regulator [Clostridium sp.]
MPQSDLTKKYYRIGDVAEMLDIPQSTLRFWEKRFTAIHPRRSAGGTRFYTPEDVERIRMIHYMVKEKKMRLEAAEESLRSNPEGIDPRVAVVNRLKAIRAEVKQLLDTLRRMR